MVKEFREFLSPTCPFTTEHLHKVPVLQKYNNKVGKTVAPHLYRYMNQMHKIDRVHLREINSSLGALSHQGMYQFDN